MQEPFALQREVIPSPGTNIANWQEMEQKIQLVSSFCNYLHIDVVDGKFAPNMTFADPTPFAQYTKHLTCEVHLMVDNPADHLDRWAQAGFTRFIAQIEKMPDIPAFVAKAENLGEVGLAIDSPTAIETLFPYIEDIDVALIMTVKAGLSRQQLMPTMLEKVKSLRKKTEFLPIEIDGGVNLETIQQAKAAGATRFVTTGYVFDHSNPSSQYARLVAAVEY